MKLCAVIRARNAEKYIGKCLKSLQKQSEDWNGVIILDAPTDNTEKIVRSFDLPLKIIVNKKRMGLGYNLYHGINQCRGDVAFVLDGDDFLKRGALKTIRRAYEKYNCLITYGSYIKMSKGRMTKVSKRRIVEPARKTKWAASHLKTFRLDLWKHFPKSHMKHKGRWAQAASDRALMYGLVELAGVDRCCHIEKPIYYWNDSTPHKTNRDLQKKWDKIMRKKKKLKKIATFVVK